MSEQVLQPEAPAAPEAREAAEPRAPFWTRHLRREVQYLLDLGVLVSAYLLACHLRFLEAPKFAYIQQLPLMVLLQMTALSIFGVYNFVWRYIGMAELRTFISAGVSCLTFSLALRLGLPESYQEWRIPISVIVLDTVLAFGGLLGIRLLRRSLYERYERRFHHQATTENVEKKRALLVGAGRAGVMAARELRQNQRGGGLEILGFVDDDPRKQDTIINGLPVLGDTTELADLVRGLGIEKVLLTVVRVRRDTMRELVETCKRLGVDVRIMPGLYEILEGRLNFFREVRIEDLLGRQAIRLEEDELKGFLPAKRLMVTGAGGSIGSELARQAARYGPESLLLVERSEPALFEIDRELTQLWPDLKVEKLIADVANESRMRAILWDYRPEIILHAAAHKHVPMMEANPTEAIRNNSLATHTLGRLAGQLGVERFVLVSTDKAVRPTSVMGASKRLAELIIQDLDDQFETRFVAVRFGNVLGSTGSVIPIFQRQIQRGGPVTVTDPAMTRYFMTIPEAAQLVLHTAAMGEGGEIFILDMGEPVKIMDLAKDMIRLAGYEPGKEIEIEITGLRPGEKLYEELELDEESLQKTRHPKIYIGRLQPDAGKPIRDALPELQQLGETASIETVRAYLAELLPEALLAKPSLRSGEKNEGRSAVEAPLANPS